MDTVVNCTPVQYLGEFNGNRLWIKREDLLGFSFGGNKARKAELFFQDIDDGEYDCVVTYGTSSSNHCRVVANECSKRKMDCYIISPEENSIETFNSAMMELLGAEVTKVPVEKVHDTIENKLTELVREGRKPYFIAGGGHGNIGTEAYVQCYTEIRQQEEELGIHFDMIFLASGTGTTQAGLISGQILNGDEREIVGISVARKNPRGSDIVKASVREYLGDKVTDAEIEEKTVFLDEYTEGYGKSSAVIKETIREVFTGYGIPLDATYTGKAFAGMKDQLKNSSGKNVLFIHTGGTPLFFDELRRGL